MFRYLFAVFGARRRGGGLLSQTQSQQSGGTQEAAPGAGGDLPSREEKLSELLSELRQRLRSRAREVQTLVRVAAVDFITPASLLALLDMLSTLPGVSSSSG